MNAKQRIRQLIETATTKEAYATLDCEEVSLSESEEFNGLTLFLGRATKDGRRKLYIGDWDERTCLGPIHAGALEGEQGVAWWAAVEKKLGRMELEG